MPSRELEAAVDAAQATEKGLCARCMEHGGLCASCADQDRAILPQLVVPSYVRLIQKAKPELEVPDPPAPPESPEACKVRLRKERRRREATLKAGRQAA